MSANRMRDPLPLQTEADARPMVSVLLSRWWAVVRHPSVHTFDRQQATARWRVVWLSLCILAVVEALGVAYVVYGPDAHVGYSSLPVGPKLHLPQTPLLPLAALIGSVAQFFIFSGLLYLSARLVGGRGTFKTQAYLYTLFWVPLMMVSDSLELVPGAGALLAVLLRLYTLYLCVLALASAHRIRLARAWLAFFVIVVAGLLLGVVTLAVVGPSLVGLVK